MLSGSERLAIVEYCGLGFVESYEHGYATCRLCGASGPEMGNCSLTDGKYVWPEGYGHYVSYHGVLPPKDFLSHALEKLEAQREAHGPGRPRMVWDYVASVPQPAPPAIQNWLAAYRSSYSKSLSKSYSKSYNKSYSETYSNSFSKAQSKPNRGTQKHTL